MRPCDVCIINSGDHTPKADVKWCGVCGKWRCPVCRGSVARITKAVVKHHTQEAVKAIKKATVSPFRVRTTLKKKGDQ